MIHYVEIALRKGENAVSVKLSNARGSNCGGWCFAFRADGTAGERILPQREAL